MPLHSRKLVRLITASFLAALFLLPESIIAQAQVDAQAQAQSQTHVVSPADLNRAAAGASQQRQQNIDTLDAFFSTDKAQQALHSAHMDPQQVKNAVASLTPDEQAQLAARANRAQADFAAGMSNNDLLIVLVLLAALILIIVAVHH